MIKTSISKETILRTGIFFALLTVAIGAFGAHGLSDLLTENGRLETFKTAVLYQLFHSIALITCGILFEKYDSKKIKISYILFTLGIIVFSGSLYILSISNIGIFGAITPIGGVLFLVGWFYLFLSIKPSHSTI
ncbi:MAG: DUF423 domain-containing protein [Ignavibacteriae bacterium HGW-Ignavibacteriae-4]|jgi:uncharacterized membrane protein YgdD (TMEM256/DUF423 family)|nr:MAG: DUF423 domain-containing protein [Ignavibacteriae bacterium HGW-Ignavibacteriae-4]